MKIIRIRKLAQDNIKADQEKNDQGYTVRSMLRDIAKWKKFLSLTENL